MTSAPRRWSSLAVSAALVSSISSSATDAPISAKRSEIPRPIPEAAPVTAAAWPSRDSSVAARSSIFLVCIIGDDKENQDKEDIELRAAISVICYHALDAKESHLQQGL